jgi:hypothetical protein
VLAKEEAPATHVARASLLSGGGAKLLKYHHPL